MRQLHTYIFTTYFYPAQVLPHHLPFCISPTNDLPCSGPYIAYLSLFRIYQAPPRIVKEDTLIMNPNSSIDELTNALQYTNLNNTNHEPQFPPGTTLDEQLLILAGVSDWKLQGEPPNAVFQVANTNTEPKHPSPPTPL